MDNIKILNNFSEEVHKVLKEYFEKKTLEYATWSTQHHACHIVEKEDKKYLKTLFPLAPSEFHLYKVIPNCMLGAHIDRGRRTALQVAMNHNDGFLTFTQYNDAKLTPDLTKNHRPYRKGEKGIIVNEGPLFFIYEEDKFEKVGTSIPYLQNTSLAHGGFNYSDIDRFFWSISFKQEKFDYVCDAFKEWA
tara:strand:- start:628 stop:1197 length:570 start_codon:yes stop_codon:yes gene_type:complete